MAENQISTRVSLPAQKKYDCALEDQKVAEIRIGLDANLWHIRSITAYGATLTIKLLVCVKDYSTRAIQDPSLTRTVALWSIRP